MRAFDRWRVLTQSERRLTIRSAMAIGAAVVALRVVNVDRLLRIAGRPVHGRTKNVIGDVVTAVDRAARYVPGATCLSKSLTLAWMLRGRGIAAEIRIGVKTAGQFEAHAWVEHEGVAVQDVPPGYASILN